MNISIYGGNDNMIGLTPEEELLEEIESFESHETAIQSAREIVKDPAVRKAQKEDPWAFLMVKRDIGY